MNSSGAQVPAKHSYHGWAMLRELAVLTPVLAVIWMAFITKLGRPSFGWYSLTFSPFWLWDALGLASIAWLVGLVARVLQRPLGKQAPLFVWLWSIMAIVALALVYLHLRGADEGNTEIAGMGTSTLLVGLGALAAVVVFIDIVPRFLKTTGAAPNLLMMLSGLIPVGILVYGSQHYFCEEMWMKGMPLGFTLAAYFGLWTMMRQPAGGQQMNVMVCAFLTAGVWMALRADGQSVVALLARTWLAMGCAFGVWLTMRNARQTKPQMGLAVETLAGYIFAAGVSLAPGVWGGDGPLIFRGEQTLALACVVALSRWMRYHAKLPEGQERMMLSRLIPLSIIGGLVLTVALWSAPHWLPSLPAQLQGGLDGCNLNNWRMCCSLALTLSGLLLTFVLRNRINEIHREMLIFCALACPVVMLCLGNLWQ